MLRTLFSALCLCLSTQHLLSQMTIINYYDYYYLPYKKDSTNTCFAEIDIPVHSDTVLIEGKKYFKLPVVLCEHNMEQLGLDHKNRLMYNYRHETFQRKNGEVNDYSTQLSYSPIPKAQWHDDAIRLYKESSKQMIRLYYSTGQVITIPPASEYLTRYYSEWDKSCYYYPVGSKLYHKGIFVVTDTTVTKNYYWAYFGVDELIDRTSRNILCPRQITPKIIDKLHERLINLGYMEPRKVKKYDTALRLALDKFHIDHKMPRGYLDLETLELLEIELEE